MDIEHKTLPEQHYLYVDRQAKFSGGGEIADAMASGFGEVFGFTKANDIEPLSMPASIYLEMPSGDTMRFRAAVFVTAVDAQKARGEVQAGRIPAGPVLTTTHVGSYASLNMTHKRLWDHADAQGLSKAMPVWEVYVDDPTTKPETEVRTEVFRAVEAADG